MKSQYLKREIDDGFDDDRMRCESEEGRERRRRSREEHERVEEGGSPNAWSLGFSKPLSLLFFPNSLDHVSRTFYLPHPLK